MVPEERFDHDTLVGIEAALHLAIHRAARGTVLRRQGREAERGRAFQIARHQEPARGKCRQPGLAAFLQVAPEQFSQGVGGRLVMRRVGGDTAERRQEVLAEGCTCRGGGGIQSSLGPFGVSDFEKRQVQQPFAGIIDDVEMHRPGSRDHREETRGANLDRQAQLADLACGNLSLIHI